MGDKFVGWAALTQLVTEIKTRIAGRISSAEKGASNGVATLDATGRVPYTQLPESAMEFEGGWDASTNTPELKDGTGTNGDFYVCNVAGTVNFGTTESPRNVTFYNNDRALYDGTNSQWIRLPASEVRTVNGMSGDVVLNIPAAQVNSDWNASSGVAKILNKPSLATVATSGSYNDLSNKPTIPAAQVNSDWNATSGKAVILNKPSLATADTAGFMSAADKTKLDGIAEGAQVNTVTGVKGNSETNYRTGNVNITKGNIGLGSVVNTGDSATPTSGGTTKFTTGGAYTELAKAKDLANATGTLAVSHGGTGQTTVVAAETAFTSGVYFNSSTAAGTATKEVTAEAAPNTVGARFVVHCVTTNTADNPVLKVLVGSDYYSYTLRYHGSALAKGYLSSTRYLEFMTHTVATKNGTAGIAELIGDLDTNSTYSGMVDAYCNTTATDAAKTASGTNVSTLKGGSCLLVRIVNANSSQTALTFNCGGTGAKNLYINGAASSSSNYTLPAGTYLFYFDGTYWYVRTDNKFIFPGSVTGVKGNSESSYRTGNVDITKANIGLGNVDNTADANKSVASANLATSLAIYYCNTNGSDTNKVVSVSSPGFALYHGLKIFVYFSYRNTASSPTLNVGDTGAKPIKVGASNYNTTTAGTPSSTSGSWNSIETGIYEATYNANYDTWTLIRITGTGPIGATCTIKAYYMDMSHGFIFFSNGILIQWGRYAPSSNRQTFPIAYSNTPLVFSNYNNNDVDRDYSPICKYVSATAFALRSPSNYSSSDNFAWIAIGFSSTL